jgi:hypothetical protein
MNMQESNHGSADLGRPYMATENPPDQAQTADTIQLSAYSK